MVMKRFFSFSISILSAFLLSACHGFVDPDLQNGQDGQEEKTDTTASLSSGYARKMIAMQFTSVGCINCPFLASALKDVVKEYPDVIPVAFHMNYGGYSDPMTLPINTKFYERVNTGDGLGLPLFALDFRKCSQYIINEYSKIMSEIELQVEQHPAVCGVALQTKYDVSKRSLEVTARFKADVAGAYRYHIFLLEDSLEYAQAGSDEETYIHDNVLRMMCGDNVMGTRLNGGDSLEPGVEYTEVKTVTLDPEWKAENMRVVVMMLDSDDEGETYCCNNAAECGLGESVDYAYVGTGSFESAFDRRVCVMEFTGTWCSQCPAGATTLNYLVDRAYKGKAFALAFHNNDAYSIPQEQELFKMFFGKDGGYPAYVIDMRKEDAGLLTEGGCRQSIENSLYDSVTHCAVSVSGVFDEATGTAGIEAKVFSELTSEYRMAAYVVEDKVIGEQLESTGTVRPDYSHRHVVRSMLSSSVYGDALGKIAAGDEAGRSFTFSMDPDWNLENLYVAVLAIDEQGHVNNMAQCLVNGGRMDYEYK